MAAGQAVFEEEGQERGGDVGQRGGETGEALGLDVLARGAGLAGGDGGVRARGVRGLGGEERGALVLREERGQDAVDDHAGEREAELAREGRGQLDGLGGGHSLRGA